MGKLTSKGKHTIKAGNHLHTDLIQNIHEKRVQMHGIGNAFEIKRSATWNYIQVYIHIYRLLYQSIMTTDNQKLQ